MACLCTKIDKNYSSSKDMTEKEHDGHCGQCGFLETGIIIRS